MKKIRLLFIIIGIWLTFSVFAYAQVDFLWMQDGKGKPGSKNNPVNIFLANENELGGFQFTLKYNPLLFYIDTVTTLGGLSNMDLHYNESTAGNLTVLATSLGGQTVSPYVEAVLQIEMSVSGTISPQTAFLELDDVVFSDIEGNTLSSASGNGYFIIEGINVLRMNNGIGPISVDLYNDVAVGGVQFTFSYDAEAISLDTILSTPRSDNMTLNYNEIQPGEVKVLLYSLAQDTILRGNGNILKIEFEVADSNATAIPLYLNDAVLSDPNGEIIVAEFFGGNYFLVHVLVLGIGESEDLLHIITHTPNITFEYSWSENLPQTHYQIQVSTHSDFSDIDMWDTDEVASSNTSVLYAGSSLLDGITYYLKAKVKNAESWIDWATLEFRMNSLPNIPIPSSPINDEVITNNTPFLWINNSTDSENDELKYDFQLATDESFTTILDSLYNVSEGNDSTFWQITTPLEDNQRYRWRARAYDGYEYGEYSHATSFILGTLSTQDDTNILIEFDISQNYPNPFNPTTTFKYDIPKESKVRLVLYDINGRLIESLVNEKQQPGYYSVQWDASQFSSGIYIYRIQADGFSAVKKCILMK